MIASGIYEIRNRMNGNRYVGSAVSIKNRWARHLGALRHNTHHNGHLQAAFDKYGEGAFVFSVLERVENFLQLIPREQHFLDTLKPEYNIAPTAGSSLGVRYSEQTRANISAARMGQKPTAEARARMSAAGMGKRNHNFGLRGEQTSMYGKPRSEATRAKISRTRMGLPVSSETRAKLSEALSGEGNGFYGKHHSEETKRKMSEARKAWWQRQKAMEASL